MGKTRSAPAVEIEKKKKKIAWKLESAAAAVHRPHCCHMCSPLLLLNV